MPRFHTLGKTSYISDHEKAGNDSHFHTVSYPHLHQSTQTCEFIIHRHPSLGPSRVRTPGGLAAGAGRRLQHPGADAAEEVWTTAAAAEGNVRFALSVGVGGHMPSEKEAMTAMWTRGEHPAGWLTETGGGG